MVLWTSPTKVFTEDHYKAPSEGVAIAATVTDSAAIAAVALDNSQHTNALQLQGPVFARGTLRPAIAEVFSLRSPATAAVALDSGTHTQTENKISRANTFRVLDPLLWKTWTAGKNPSMFMQGSHHK